MGIANYLAMGGYAVFVWPAYGIALLVLGGLAWQSWRRYSASCRMLETVQRRAGPAAMPQEPPNRPERGIRQ